MIDRLQTEVIHFFEAATRKALDAADSNGDPIFKSVTKTVAGRTKILGEPRPAIKQRSSASQFGAIA